MACPNCHTLFPGSGTHCVKCGGALALQTSTWTESSDTAIGVSPTRVPPIAGSTAPSAGQIGNRQLELHAGPARVVVTDFNMSFGSMVVFLVKLTIAAIPAMVILTVIAAVLLALLGALGIIFL